MKALSRAIARTVSQIARHAGEGCHVPMIMALENHLDALLGMERKQLEQASGKLVAFSTPQEKAGTIHARFLDEASLKIDGEKWWTPEKAAKFNAMFVTTAPDKSSIHDRMMKLVMKPISRWTSDDLAFFKGHTALSKDIIDGLDAAWDAANTQAGQPPAPDAIDMTDPRNWQDGDVLKRKQYPKSPNFTAYKQYVVAENDGRYVRITGNDGTPVSYPLDMVQSEPASNFFTWIRHADDHGINDKPTA